MCPPPLSLRRRLDDFASRWFNLASTAAFTLLVVVAVWSALQKPFWFDEMITVLLSRLSPQQLWTALSNGTDSNPPMLHLLVRFLSKFIPSPELACRLPSIGYFTVLAPLLYWVAKPYLGREFAIAAAALPLVTFASTYIIEGRAYASTLAFSATSILLWREAISGRRRTISLVGLTLAIALAVSFQYTATLIISALVVGEAVRTVSRRRLDFPVWFAILLGGLPLLFFRPLIAAVKPYMAAFWSRLTLPSTFTETRRALLQNKGIYLFVIALITVLLRRDATEESARPKMLIYKMPIYEKAAWFTLLCAPLEGYIQSKFTGGFTIRYAIPMVLPFALLVAWICSRVSHGSCFVALVIVTVSTAVGVKNIRSSVASNPNFFHLFQSSLRAYLPSGEKLLIGSPLAFPPMYYYSREPLRSRLAFITDPDLAAQILGENSPDITIQQLSKFSPMPTYDYASFVRQHKPFALFLTNADLFSWIKIKLASDSIPIKMLACAPVGCLYQVG